MGFHYYIPTKILFGRGQIDRLHEETLPGKKALVVISAGKSIRANGYLAKVEEQLAMAGVQSVVFDKILPNPALAQVMVGAAEAKRNGCDFVVGLGGGSSIDAAKAIAVMATNEGDYWDYMSGGSGKGRQFQNDPLPVVAITTTAGTGTEADQWMVVTKEETNEKIGFGCDKTFPVLSVVDAELMISVPPDLTAYQGFDALFHSAEGYIADIANPVSDLLALESIRLIAQNLPEAVKNGGNVDAREAVALANTLAGMVEAISSCTAEHGLEHAMSAHHTSLSHGAGLIMISREFFTYSAQAGGCAGRMIDMAKAMGKEDAASPMDFVEALVELQKTCGVDKLHMSDYGIKQEELSDFVANARDTMGGVFERDRIPLADEDCLKIYEDSYR